MKIFVAHSRAVLSIVIVELALIVVAAPYASAQIAPALPALPQIFLDTTPPSSAGATIVVPGGGDFQAALNAAQPGDQIILQAGATYTGPFTLPLKNGNDWIVVRSSAEANLPPYGSRIAPASSSSMPKILTTSSQAALRTAPGAHHFRFVGIEFAVASGVTLNYGIVTMGDGSSAQNALSQVPYALVFDRVYVHGNPTGNMMRGIALNSASTAVVNSYVADIHAVGYDTQAIAGWNGPGPFKIANNYLEAAAENVLFGGADPSIANLVPSDIEVRGNYLFKPLTWRQGSATYAGIPWSIKNIFELKNAQRVLVDGNVMENNWLQAQNGYSVLFTVRNQGGTAPWSIVADVTFTHNILRHVANAVNVLGHDDVNPSQQANRILVQNNLFDDVNAAAWGGSGRLLQLLGGPANLTIDHNTAFQSGDFITASGQPVLGFTYTNNIAPNNKYGLGGDNCYGQPLLCISTFFPGSVITGDVIVGGSRTLYPTGNFFPATLSDVGFVSLTGANYQLADTSLFRNAGTDGKDVGVDWAALVAATGGSMSGADMLPPAVTITQPAVNGNASGSIIVSAAASDAQSAVTQVVLLVDGAPLASFGAPPYQTSWDTTAIANGTHLISATATDGAGNQATSSVVAMTVTNLVISGVLASNVSDTAATIAWSTNLAADSQVQYGTTTAYGSTSAWDATMVTNHGQSLSGLAAATTYHYRVVSRDANGNVASSADSVFTTAQPVIVAIAPVPVVWTSLVNVTATGGSLKKTSGCNGCQDAGAVSSQTISSGDGYLEFTMGEVVTERAIGLSRGNPGTTINEIAFCLLIWPGGGVNVRETGVYRMGLVMAAGDTLRISVTGGVVTYSRNGTVFYTSKVAPSYPLIADTSFLTAAGTITNAVISGAR